MTWPNFITIARFLMVPFLILALMQDEALVAFIIFLAAGLSDAIDGFIARRFNQASELGAYLDPVADKLLLVSSFIMLGYLGTLPEWLVILVVSRDVLIVGAVVLSHVVGNPVKVRPLMVSKATTAFQIGLVVCALAARAGIVDLVALTDSLVLAVAGLTMASAAAYLLGWLRHMARSE